MAEHFEFPDELYGATIDGIDITILNSDSLRLIDAYGKQGAELSDIQYRVLLQCERELKQIMPHLEAKHHKYFVYLHKNLEAVIKKIKQRS